jgi:hypothetical protein
MTKRLLAKLSKTSVKLTAGVSGLQRLEVQVPRAFGDSFSHIGRGNKQRPTRHVN